MNYCLVVLTSLKDEVSSVTRARGERIPDPDSCKLLVPRIAERFTLPYLTITPTFSICLDHGYQAGEHFNYPVCGKSTEVYNRVVGYYRPVQNWHKGKREE